MKVGVFRPLQQNSADVERDQATACRCYCRCWCCYRASSLELRRAWLLVAVFSTNPCSVVWADSDAAEQCLGVKGSPCRRSGLRQEDNLPPLKKRGADWRRRRRRRRHCSGQGQTPYPQLLGDLLPTDSSRLRDPYWQHPKGNDTRDSSNTWGGTETPGYTCGNMGVAEAVIN